MRRCPLRAACGWATSRTTGRAATTTSLSAAGTPTARRSRCSGKRLSVPSLSERLIAEGRPLLDLQLAHPTVAGIARGDLDESVFRSWLEQDYLFLLDYARVFARLAWQAPDAAHLATLVGLAYSTLHEELDLHRSLA